MRACLRRACAARHQKRVLSQVRVAVHRDDRASGGERRAQRDGELMDGEEFPPNLCNVVDSTTLKWVSPGLLSGNGGRIPSGSFRILKARFRPCFVQVILLT